MSSLRRSSLLASATVALGLSVSLGAWASLSKVGGSSVGFHASGPIGMSIDGSTGDVSVADDGQNVTISVGLGSLGTGLGLRDSHMKDKYLQVGSFPKAELVLPRSSLTIPAPGQSASGNAAGTLTLHGQSRSVNVHYQAAPAGDHVEVSATMPVNMNDFGIETPGYMGAEVKPAVSVWAKLQLKDN